MLFGRNPPFLDKSSGKKMIIIFASLTWKGCGWVAEDSVTGIEESFHVLAPCISSAQN